MRILPISCFVPYPCSIANPTPLPHAAHTFPHVPPHLCVAVRELVTYGIKDPSLAPTSQVGPTSVTFSSKPPYIPGWSSPSCLPIIMAPAMSSYHPIKHAFMPH